MPGWTDAHNHLQDPRLGEAAPVIAAMRAAGVERCVVNATREADWPAVEKLALAHPDFVFPAFGIHAWHAHTVTDGWQKRLTSLLEKQAMAGALRSPGMTIVDPGATWESAFLFGGLIQTCRGTSWCVGG